jgi:hypothetical protein
MVRDAYVGAQPQQADDGAAGQPLDLRGSTANLTQELSQLLAASIAQGQSGNRAPGTMAAGSELANLAALVSASQSQRNHQPSFRDGLSSLSYARPSQQHVPPPPPPPVPAHVPNHVPTHVPTGAGLLVAEPHDEEPMPIPSTWRQPMSGDDDRWYRQQLGAAALGLVAGLVVVVPAVLWLSGWLGGPQAKAVVARHQSTAEAAPVRVAEVKPVKVQTATAAEAPRVRVTAPPAAEPQQPKVAILAAPPPRAEPPPAQAELPPARVEPPLARLEPSPPPPRAEPVRSRADELVAQAKRMIETGDIPGARTVLQVAEANSSGPMTFMLAETYDPNMLASWQTRGITANPERARALYQKAQDLGEGRAQQRLDWLTGN